MQPGQVISHYRIAEKIGAGGMGVVYRAHNIHLDREVAIKVLPERALQDEEARRRFAREAKKLSSLNHRHVAIVHDFDTAGGMDFLVMEYVPGVTLNEKLVAGPFPEAETLALAKQLVDGLEAAHAHGIIHRDIKPGNLRITPDGTLKILDFGLAKLLHASDSKSTETVTGGRAGTLPYMAPEQVDGRADERTDVYSVGVVLYEMATGRRPFTAADSLQLLNAILRSEPPAPTSLNRRVSLDLERIILKAMDKGPERRYQTMRELQVDLLRLTKPGPSESVQPRPSPRPRPWRRLITRVIAATTTVALAVVIGNYVRNRNAAPPLNPVLVHLSTTSGPIEESRLSPDGEWVSQTGSHENRSGLWLRRAGEGEPVHFVPMSGDVQSHAWSPDGRRIAVLLTQEGAAFLQFVSAFGGPPENSAKLDDFFKSAMLVRWIGAHIYIERAGLWRYGIDTSKVEKLLERTGAQGERRSDFDVCEDESRVVFKRARSGQVVVWSSDLAGKDAIPLAPPDAGSTGPRWMGAECREVVFSSDRSGQFDLWKLTIPSRVLEQITFSSNVEFVLETSRDGRRLLFRQDESRSNLWRLEPRPGAVRRWRLTAGQSYLDSWPSSDASGSLVAFQRLKPMLQGLDFFAAQLHLAERDSTGLANVRLLNLDGGGARLSPDGRSLAFIRKSAGGGHELWMQELSTGHSWRVAARYAVDSVWPFPLDLSGFNVVWDRQSSAVFFVATEDSGQLIQRLEGGRSDAVPATVVAPTDGLALSDPQLSPDGRWLCYVRSARDDTKHEVFCRDLLSQEERLLLAVEGASARVRCRGIRASTGALVVLSAMQNLDLTYRAEVLEIPMSGSPRAAGVVDGVYLASTRLNPRAGVLYLTKTDGLVHNLYAFALADGTLRRLTDNTVPGVSFSGAEILADGTIIYSEQEESVSTWLIRFEQNGNTRKGES